MALASSVYCLLAHFGLLRRELGLLEPKRRVATAALAFSVTLAVNTTGAVADVMALF